MESHIQRAVVLKTSEASEIYDTQISIGAVLVVGGERRGGVWSMGVFFKKNIS